MRGITFEGKHSYKDFGLTIAPGRNIGNPSKIKRKERVPFSNKIYDFSGIYGDQEYEERPLTYTFNIIADKKVQLSFIKTEALNWLMGSSGKVKLMDDAIPGYYFLAEVENGPDFDENEADGALTVEFTAYPYKVSEHEEGSDIWDDFNFLLDYAQETEFTIRGSKQVVLYNPGAAIARPRMQASAAMQITKGGTVYFVPTGESHSPDFILNKGENILSISGNGTISFHFRKEMI